MAPDDEILNALSDPPPAPLDDRRRAAGAKRSQWFWRIDPSPEERKLFLEQLSIYLAAMYPGSSRRQRRELVRRAREKGHYGRLGEVAGVLVTNSIRHRLTDYEWLLRLNGGGEGLTRDEARQVVRPEVADIVALWQAGSAEKDGGYIAVRRQFRKVWRQGRKKPRPVVTARENAAIAEYLKEWLKRSVEGPQLPREAVEAAAE